MRNEKNLIAVEGYPFIAVAGFTALMFAVLSWKLPAVFAFCLTLFIAYFFRNPERTVPQDENAVVAPADGVVIYLGKAREEHTGVEMMKISIFMSVFNVHINRSPVTGGVVDTFYSRGKFLDVRDERATFENERAGLVIEGPHGKRIVVVQVAGLIARRIVCYLQKGDSVTRGARYGLIRFGSRLDVYLPGEADIRVKSGEKTVAGETILGYLS
ncbi:MAG TPA: phosphatidylserine decarboxylase family protein [Geobacteraceae bacterium]|nr:phosphatidylserine decarboxylase family protein [Geobacteraceae bacterium]